MSDKHKHRLLFHTKESYVLVYLRSPLCATLPSYKISGPSCHALRPMPSPYDHLTSPHLQGWTHTLCSALPCDTPSSGCPIPAISQPSPPPSPCPCLPMLFFLYSCFFPSGELFIYQSFLIHQKWSRSDTTSWRSHRQHVYILTFSCIQCISACLWLGISSVAEGQPAEQNTSGALVRHGDARCAGLQALVKKTAGGIQNFWGKSTEEHLGASRHMPISEWLFHLSEAFKTTDKKKTSQTLTRYSLFFSQYSLLALLYNSAADPPETRKSI